MSDKSSPPSQTTVISAVMVVTLLGKLLGLWRDRLLALYYGTGMEANAFYTASRIPRVFFDTIFAAAIASCFIPVLAHYTQKEGKQSADRFAGNFISVMGVLTLALTLVGMAFPEPFVEVFGSGYDLETKALATKLTRLLFPTVFFTGIAFSFVGILQGNGHFLVPALISSVSNGIIILYFYGFDHRFGIFGLGIAYLLGWLAQSVFQLPTLRKIGFSYRPDFRFRTEGMKRVFALMGPVMVATWVQPINLTINTSFASHLHEGAGVSAIEIASNLYFIIAGVFVLSVTNVIFPRLAKLTAQGEETSFEKTLQDTLHVTLFFILPMSVGLMVVAKPLVTLLFGGGEFDAFSINITSQALVFISLGMVGYGVQNVVSRACFAKGDGKSPLYAGFLSIGVNVALSVALLTPLGVGGLALASALSATLYALLLLALYHKQGGSAMTKALWIDCLKMLISALIMGVVAHQILKFTLPVGNILALAITATVGGVVYGGLTLGFKLQEAVFVRQTLTHKRSK